MARNSTRSWPFDNFRKMSIDRSMSRHTAYGPPRVTGVDGRELGGLRPDVGFLSIQLSSVGLLQTQERQPTWAAGFEIQKGTGSHMIGGVAMLDGPNVVIHWYDRENDVWPIPHFITQSFSGTADDLDMAIRGRYLLFTSLGTSGAPLVVWHDGSDWRHEDMGPLQEDGWSAPTPSGQNSNGLLSNGSYAIAVRRFNSERGVFDGKSETVVKEMALGGDLQRIAWGAQIQEEDGFDQVYCYRSVAGGTTLYLEHIEDVGALETIWFGDKNAGTGLTDHQLQLQEPWEPYADPVRLPPKTNRIASFQGLTVMKLAGDDAGEQALGDLVWSLTHRIAPEEFGPDSVYPAPSNIGQVIQFIEAGDFMLGLTPVSTIRMQKSGIDVAIQPIHRGWGPMSRYAAVDFGPAVMVAGPRGLYMLEAATGKLQVLEAVDRLMTNDDEWLHDIIADQAATGAPNIQLSYDEPQGCIYVLNSAKKECVCVWTKTSRITMREDFPFELTWTAPHPETSGPRRSMFAGIPTGTTPAYVQADRIFYPDAFREGAKQTMSGTLDPSTEVNGTATGGTTVSLTDSSNYFGEGVYGAYVHIWQTDDDGVETRVRRLAVPGPAFILDDFNRDDAEDLGGSWSQTGSGVSGYWNSMYWNSMYWNSMYWSALSEAAIRVSGNAALASDLDSAPIQYSAIWTDEVGQDDYDVEAEFTPNGTSTPWMQLHGRRVSPTSADYEGYLMTASMKATTIGGRTLEANRVYIDYVKSDGTLVAMGDAAHAFSPGTEYTLKFSLRGNILRAYVDGSEALRVVADEQAVSAGDPKTLTHGLGDATDTTYIDCDRMASDRFVVVYRRSDGRGDAVIATVSGNDITWGDATQIDTDFRYGAVCALDTNTAFVFYNKDSVDGDGLSRVITRSGSGVSVGTATTWLASATTDEGARWMDCVALTGDLAAVVVSDWTDGKKVKIGFFGTDDAEGGGAWGGSLVTVHAGACADDGIRVARIDSTTVLVAYVDADDDNAGKVKVVRESGLSGTVGAAVTFHDSPGGVNPDMSLVGWSSTEAVLCYYAVQEQEARAVVLTVSGLDVTVGECPDAAKFATGADHMSVAVLEQARVSFGAACEFSAGIDENLYNMSVAALSASRIVVTYTRNGNDSYTRIGDLSGSDITWGSEITGPGGASYTKAIEVAALDSSTFVAAWIHTSSPYDPCSCAAGYVSGTDITFSSTVQLEGNSNGAYLVDIVALDSTRAVAAWKLESTPTSVRAMVLTVAGGAVSHGAYATFAVANGVVSYGLALCALSSSSFVLAASNDSSGTVSLYAASVSGETISLGAVSYTSPAGGTPQFLSMSRLSGTQAVLCYNDPGAVTVETGSHILTVNGLDVTSGARDPIDESPYGRAGEVVALDSTHLVYAITSNADDNRGLAWTGTVDGASVSWEHGPEVFSEAATEREIRVARVSATEFVVLAHTSASDTGHAYVGEITGEDSKRLVLTYRDFAADNYGKARIGDVSAGAVEWAEYARFLDPAAPGGAATPIDMAVAMSDWDSALLIFQHVEDTATAKGVVLGVPGLGDAEILTDGGHAGFGVSFDGDGSESVAVDDWRVVAESYTIGLTPALDSPVRAGDRYSVSPVPFGVTFPALTEGNKVDHHIRLIVEGMKAEIARYSPDDVDVNEKLRFQLFLNGSEIEGAGRDVDLTEDQGELATHFEGVSGHMVHPGVECYASNTDFELVSVRVEGGVADTDMDG